MQVSAVRRGSASAVAAKAWPGNPPILSPPLPAPCYVLTRLLARNDRLNRISLSSITSTADYYPQVITTRWGGLNESSIQVRQTVRRSRRLDVWIRGSKCCLTIGCAGQCSTSSVRNRYDMHVVWAKLHGRTPRFHRQRTGVLWPNCHFCPLGS